MKTLTALTVVLLATIVTASADEKREIKSETVATGIKAPAFKFGSPGDINASDVETLKYAALRAPAFIWGDPEDTEVSELKNTGMENKPVKAPAFEWGSADDMNAVEIELLKVKAPAFVWGLPGDEDQKELAKLKLK